MTALPALGACRKMSDEIEGALGASPKFPTESKGLPGQGTLVPSCAVLLKVLTPTMGRAARMYLARAGA